MSSRFTIIKTIHHHDKPKGEYMKVESINVTGCKQYPDVTYIETVEITLVPCDKFRAVWGCDIHKKVKVIFEIETGYLPYDVVAQTLKDNLIKFNIINIDEFIGAFKYRSFYCKI